MQSQALQQVKQGREPEKQENFLQVWSDYRKKTRKLLIWVGFERKKCHKRWIPRIKHFICNDDDTDIYSIEKGENLNFVL